MNSLKCQNGLTPRVLFKVITKYFVVFAFFLTTFSLNAKIIIDGASSDVMIFNDLINNGKSQSEHFKKLIDSFESSDKVLQINVGRNIRGVAIFQFKKNGPQTVDLDDLLQFPNKVDHQFSPAAYYEKLAFILCVGYHTVLTGNNYIACYEKGLNEQHRVRVDFGQRESPRYSRLVKHGIHWDGVTWYRATLYLGPGPYDGRKEFVHLIDGQIDDITYKEL